MNPNLLSPIAILDETSVALRRVAAPWLGVLWISTLPYRFLQAHYGRELFELGGKAGHYGDYLGGLAIATFIAFLPALYGRAVFARACRLGLQSGASVGRESLRVPPAELANLLYVSLVVELFFYLSIWSFVTIPFFLLLSGLAVATAHRSERPGLFRPFRELFTFSSNVWVLFTLGLTFGVALLLAYINIYLLFRAGAWAIGGVAGLDAAKWEHLLRPTGLPIFPAEPMMRWICGAGTALLIEPFWLAALSVYVHRARLRETGEDLRFWFEKLRRSTG